MANAKPAPGVIQKLDEGVINRIAAGEVIQRPANALKELIENSIDAGARNIQVITKDGGMKFLQIQDDGCGIRKEDLPIACERFTTSKLKVFEDLQTIQTYGFRGEALASISHVAHLTILTKTEGSVCAYRAEYLNGKLTEKDKANPQAQAGNLGTTITVENLFYNIDSRKNILKPPEEYNKILEVVNRYSIHNYKTGFSLKKYGENSFEMRTPPNSTVIDNIRVLYGVEVARELVAVSCEGDVSKFKMTGYVSNGNYSIKRPSFILFINHRLVDSSGLKKVLEGIYSTYIPKGSHPFIYLSLELDPRSIDVNIHPTKQEVHFLHEDIITAEIGNTIDKVLQGSNQSRTFYIQSLLPTASPKTNSDPKKSSGQDKKSFYDCPSGKRGNDGQVAPKHLVRTDPKERTLDTFLSTSTTNIMNRDADSTKNSSPARKNSTVSRPRRVVNLDSVKNLCQEIQKGCQTDMMMAFRNHTFVGCVNRTHALIQYNTKLYMVNTVMKSKELFYQKMMLNFGNIGCLQFEDPIPVRDLIRVALKETEVGEVAAEAIDVMSHDIATFLQSKADMLSDYFSVQISSEGTLEGIPMLLDNYMPCIELVPFYLVNLAKRVDWESETECFRTFCLETAHFYAVPPGDDADNEELLLTGNTWKWTIEHVIYPELKKSLMPQKTASSDATVIELADLPSLYKVFERC